MKMARSEEEDEDDGDSEVETVTATDNEATQLYNCYTTLVLPRSSRPGF